MVVLCWIMYTLLIGNTKHDNVTQNRCTVSSKSFNVSYEKSSSSLLTVPHREYIVLLFER